MISLATNPRTDLHRAFPWGDGQTLLREALLLADHNAYHVGQIVDLRRALGIWKKETSYVPSRTALASDANPNCGKGDDVGIAEKTGGVRVSAQKRSIF